MKIQPVRIYQFLTYSGIILMASCRAITSCNKVTLKWRSRKRRGTALQYTRCRKMGMNYPFAPYITPHLWQLDFQLMNLGFIPSEGQLKVNVVRTLPYTTVRVVWWLQNDTADAKRKLSQSGLTDPSLASHLWLY